MRRVQGAQKFEEGIKMERVLKIRGARREPPAGIVDRRDVNVNRFEREVNQVYVQFHELLIGEHPKRVASYACAIATYLQPEIGFSDFDVREITIAALLHDIGKMDPEYTHLFRTGRLEYTPKLRRLLAERHQRPGMEMARKLDLGPYDKHRPSIIAACGHHHDKSEQLRESELPDHANIWAVHITRIADIFDTITKGEDDHEYVEKVSKYRAARLMWFLREHGYYEPRATELFVERKLQYDPRRLPQPPAEDLAYYPHLASLVQEN